MIRTKVAQILSPTQVVLAASAVDGVQEGMKFIIYELSEVILDPETNEPLGQLELVKGRVEASHVQDKICVARTLTREVSRPRWPFNLTYDYAEVSVKLPVDESDVAVKNDLKVRVGDLVRSVE